MKLFTRILRILWIALAVALFLSTAYWFFITKSVALIPEKIALPTHSITIYDKEHKSVSMLAGTQQKESVYFDDLPKHTVNAFVSTEDKRFFSHHGFDLPRIVKSIYTNVKAGYFRQGASTISQQLIKNTHLSHEKTLARKLKECKLTIQLEKRFSKQEILQSYLSTIYFGHNCFGIQSASAFYFNKTASELDIADSAILAGLVCAPNYYSPFQNPEACQKRKSIVLSLMEKNAYITPEQKRDALEKPLPIASSSKAQSFDYARNVFQELSYLAKENGFQIAGNVAVQTYIDVPLQELAQKCVYTADTDASVLVIDVQTKGVKAFASTIGNAKRLPGSLLKPLLIYAPALEENLISPATPLLDEKVQYGSYAPSNYDGTYHGYVSARECLANSLNIPAVKLLNTLGVNKGASYLEKMQLPVENDDKTLALALGGMKNGYTLQELVSAYATLPSQGTYSKSAFIQSVEIDGKQVYQRKMQTKQVFSEDTAYLTCNMLQTTSKSGTGKKLRSLPFDIASKTGTVGTEKGNTDAYAVGYTTRDVIGVWHGDANGQFIQTTGGGLPCNTLYNLHAYLYDVYTKNNVELSPFFPPNTVKKIALDKTIYDTKHFTALADCASPQSAQFYEWFKESAIPCVQSDLYSNPSITFPSIDCKNGTVYISFDTPIVLPYDIKIERLDYRTNSWKTLYTGTAKPVFTDDTIIQENKYIYKITPSYNGHIGQAITLPTVDMKREEITSPYDREITQKDWWQY